MNRQEQIEKHNRNVKEAFAAAQRGEVINLSALMGGHQEIHCDDVDGKKERGEKVYSDGWKLSEEEQQRLVGKR